jgi:uncharacterized protein
MQRKIHKAGTAQKKQIKEGISAILKAKQGIDFAYLFGSFTEKNLPFHDIDLGVFFNEKEPFDMYETANELAFVLQQQVALPVDVRVLNNAPVSFMYHVMKGELTLDNDEEIRCRLMEQTVRQYLDMRPILYRAMKEAFS